MRSIAFLYISYYLSTSNIGIFIRIMSLLAYIAATLLKSLLYSNIIDIKNQSPAKCRPADQTPLGVVFRLCRTPRDTWPIRCGRTWLSEDISASTKLSPIQDWDLDDIQIRYWRYLDFQAKPPTRSEKESVCLRLKIFRYLVQANPKAV